MHTPLQDESRDREVVTLSPSAKRERRSNMELLRILAMFMILVLHTSYEACFRGTTAS